MPSNDLHTQLFCWTTSTLSSKTEYVGQTSDAAGGKRSTASLQISATGEDPPPHLEPLRFFMLQDRQSLPFPCPNGYTAA